MTPIESWKKAFEEMMLSIDMKEAFRTKLEEAYRKGREDVPVNVVHHKRDCCEWYGGCTCVGCECYELSNQQREARHAGEVSKD